MWKWTWISRPLSGHSGALTISGWIPSQLTSDFHLTDEKTSVGPETSFLGDLFKLHVWIQAAENTIGCAFVSVFGGQTDAESKFCLTDDKVEVHAINEAITDAHQRNLNELDIYSEIGTSVFNILVSRHRTVKV